MKNLLDQILRKAVSIDWLWKLLHALLVKPANKLSRLRYQREVGQLALRIVPDLTVEAGPFEGMRYPSANSVGSAVIPKLLGVYESELHPSIEKLLEGSYGSVVDVGCAEGYYAVGLAMKCPGATVEAYDTNARARKLCEELAGLNGVGDRLRTHGLCSPEEMTRLAKSADSRMLVISDCEGFEKELFGEPVVEHLKGHDLLIEVHDEEDPGLSSLLFERLSATHRIERVPTIPDLERLKACEIAKLDKCTLREKKIAIYENRKGPMEWFVATGKV